MRAYVDVGELQEADKVGAEVGRTRDELMSLTGTTAYVLDEHADILSMLGKAEEADRRRAALVETWSDSRRWIISMAINRLAALFTAHRYEEVLRELDRPNRRYQQNFTLCKAVASSASSWQPDRSREAPGGLDFSSPNCRLTKPMRVQQR